MINRSDDWTVIIQSLFITLLFTIHFTVHIERWYATVEFKSKSNNWYKNICRIQTSLEGSSIYIYIYIPTIGKLIFHFCLKHGLLTLFKYIYINRYKKEKKKKKGFGKA